MNTGLLVIKNLTRNPLRSALTMAAVALPMALFLLTTAIRDVLDAVVYGAAKELRIGVHNKISLINPLPAGMRGKIQALDPDGALIEGICGMKWFGGTVKDVPGVIPSLAGDPDSWPIVYADYKLTPEELKAWETTKNGAIVGKYTAEKFGWKVGQEFEMKSSVPPFQELRFKCVKVAESGRDLSVVYFRRDYLDDQLEAMVGAKKEQYGHGRVNIFWVKCKDPARMDELGRTIDAAFENTPDETKTEDESTFIAGFIKAGGDFPGKLQIVGMAVVVAIVMVVANTMSQSFRERTRELAAFKALGFPNRWIVGTVVGEAMALTLAGGALGLIPTYLAFLNGVRIPGLQGPPLTIPEKSLITASLVVLAIGLIAGAVPAWSAVRLKVVEALRKLA